MRLWPILLVVILMGSGCASGESEFVPKPPVDDRRAMGLKGDVLMFMEHERGLIFREENEVKSEYLMKETVVKFNSNGQLKSSSDIETEGHFLYVSHQYDGDGRFQSKKVERDGHVESETRFDYFGHGLLREQQILDGNQAISSKTNYQYDENQYLVKMVNFYYYLTTGSKSQETVYKILYERDDVGRLLKEEAYRNDVLENVIEYQDGKRKRRLKYSPDQDQPAVEYHYYSSLLDSSWWIEPDGGLSSWRTMRYNDSGDLLIGADSSKKGLIVMEYDYDEIGNVVRQQYQGPTISTDHSFEYAYDSLENWTRKEEFHGGIPFRYYSRTITYQ